MVGVRVRVGFGVRVRVRVRVRVTGLKVYLTERVIIGLGCGSWLGSGLG